MTEKKHALLSPSGASRWLSCPGSVALSKDIPDIQSDYALEGTAAHTLAQYCFADKNDAKKHVGKMYNVGDDVFAWKIEEDMAEYVQVYLGYVRREASGGRFLVEQRLPLTPLTGEEDAFGTADVVIIKDDMLHIVDLKFGMGVRVEAENNEQLMLYAAAAAHEYSVFGDFKRFKVTVVQPRLDHIDSWEFGAEELTAFVEKIKAVAPVALDGTGALNPSEDTCRFCKAKAVCPALAKVLIDFSMTSFENLNKEPEANLSRLMSLLGLIEDGANAVRAEVERRLVSGVVCSDIILPNLTRPRAVRNTPIRA